MYEYVGEQLPCVMTDNQPWITKLQLGHVMHVRSLWVDWEWYPAGMHVTDTHKRQAYAHKHGYENERLYILAWFFGNLGVMKAALQSLCHKFAQVPLNAKMNLHSGLIPDIVVFFSSCFLFDAFLYAVYIVLSTVPKQSLHMALFTSTVGHSSFVYSSGRCHQLKIILYDSQRAW